MQDYLCVVILCVLVTNVIVMNRRLGRVEGKLDVMNGCKPKKTNRSEEDKT